MRACSINPVDIKVRSGTYDDYPDYYDRCPHPQILGFDGAGVVKATGPRASHLSPGDEVFYSGSPIRQGSNADLQLVDGRAVVKKPRVWTWEQAAAMPLTWITAYEALVERMEIRKGERSGLLIVNGSGGVGSAATQVAREILQLPVIVATASRKETQDFVLDLGATHVVNHRKDIEPQLKELKLDVPIKCGSSNLPRVFVNSC